MRGDRRPPSEIFLTEEVISEAEMESWLLSVASTIAEIRACILFEGSKDAASEGAEGFIRSIGMLEVEVVLGDGTRDIRRCVLMGTEGYGSSIEAEYNIVLDTATEYLEDLSGRVGRRIPFVALKF